MPGVVLVGYAVGMCPRCGAVHKQPRPETSVVCDCWLKCPVCGERTMVPLSDGDFDPLTYGSEQNSYGQSVTFSTVARCSVCGWLNEDGPVEVELE